MPRATTSENDTTPKAAPRKRVARPRVAPAEKPAPRPRRAARTVATEASAPASTPTRRAPTTVSRHTTESRESSKKPPVGLMVLIFFCLILVGVGVGIGMSDRGQIDVTAVVNERNERINRGEVREGESVAPTATPQATGRLRPAAPTTNASDTNSPEPVSELVATTTATDTATTTDETITTEPLIEEVITEDSAEVAE